MFKKTLTSILAGISLFGMQPAKAVTNDVHVYNWGTDFADVLEASSDGDVLRLTPVNGYTWNANDDINKSITLIGDLNNGIDIRGNINIVGDARVNIDLTGQIMWGTINARDNSSLDLRNTNFTPYEPDVNVVNFNSTGNLNVQDCYFGTPYPAVSTAINAQNYGGINLSRNIFAEFDRAINIAPTSNGVREAYILNNTMDRIHGTAINLADESGLIKILNNLVNESVKDIQTTSTSNVTYESNNLWLSDEPLTLSLNQLPSEEPFGNNYSFEPDFLYRNDPTYQLSTNSPLWFKGQYLDGQTTWFPDTQRTWIGQNGEGMPVVPEPKTWALVGLGLAGLYVINNMRKNRYKRDVDERINKWLTGRSTRNYE